MMRYMEQLGILDVKAVELTSHATDNCHCPQRDLYSLDRCIPLHHRFQKRNMFCAFLGCR